MIAYYLPMRQAEIINFTWEEIDLNNKFIRLGGQRTKNKTGRVVPFNQRIFNYLISLTRPISGVYVFEQIWWNRKEFVDPVSSPVGLYAESHPSSFLYFIQLPYLNQASLKHFICNLTDTQSSTLRHWHRGVLEVRENGSTEYWRFFPIF